MIYGPEALDDHVCSCGHPWTDHDSSGCGLLACPCTPEPEPKENTMADRETACCTAVINVELVLDDYDGPVPNPFRCTRPPHPRTELHEAAVQWFSGEDDD